MFYENLDLQISSGSLQSIPTATVVDFSTTSLAPHYSNYYALIIDDCFTASECADLIGLADSDWKAAARNTNFRDCERIMKDDVVAAKRVYDRVKPFLEDVAEIDVDGKWWNGVVGKNGGRNGMCKGRWRMARLNERLRFLKYGEGQFFKPHCDSCYNAPDKSLKSFLTLHLYLNDSTPSTQDADPAAPPQVLKKGGATRFWSPGKDQYLDVEPKRGRVLVFQQRMLLHSGEAVEEGIKMTMRSDLMYEWVPYERASEVEKGKGVEQVIYNPMNL